MITKPDAHVIDKSKSTQEPVNSFNALSNGKRPGARNRNLRAALGLLEKRFGEVNISRATTSEPSEFSSERR